MAYLDTSGLSTRELDTGGDIPTFLTIGVSNGELTAIDISYDNTEGSQGFLTTVKGELEVEDNVVFNNSLTIKEDAVINNSFICENSVGIGFDSDLGLYQAFKIDVSGNSWIHGNFVYLSNSPNFFDVTPKLYLTNNDNNNYFGSQGLNIDSLVGTNNLSWAHNFSDQAIVIQDSALYIDGSGYDYTNLYVQGKSFFNNDICLNQSLIMGRGLYVGGVASSLNDLCVHDNLIGSVTLGFDDYQDNVKLDVCGNVAFGIGNRIDSDTIASGVVGFDNSLNNALYSFVSGRGNDIKVAPTDETFQSNYIFGINNTISGDYNFINGVSNEIDGDFNIAMGINNIVRGQADGSILLGTGLDVSVNNCVVFGHFNKDISNATFVVGTGASDTNRVNTFVVTMGGRIGLNTDEPLADMDICGTGGLILPRGTNSQRIVENNGGDEYLGLVRYNTDTKSFEGFGAGNSWGSLGGVIDVSQCTYITAEDSAGAANKQIKFYVNRVDNNNDPIAPSSNTDGSGYVMIIDSSGWVGIGNHQDDGKYRPLTILDLSCGDSQGDMSGACGLILPRGGTNERPISNTHDNYDDISGSYLGCIRYNDETSSFEGFGAGNSWGTLGGVIDVDQSTYITAEDYADASNNDTTNHSTKAIKFYINNSSTPSEIASNSQDNSTFDTSYNMILTGGGDVCQLAVCQGKSLTEIETKLGGATKNGIYTDGNLVVDTDASINGTLSVQGDISIDGGMELNDKLLVNITDSNQYFSYDGDCSINSGDFYINDGSLNIISSDGTTTLTIRPIGMVSIGKDNPDYNLDVSGDIYASENLLLDGKISMSNKVNIETNHIFGNINVTKPSYAWEFRNNTGTSNVIDIINEYNAQVIGRAYSTYNGMVFDGSGGYLNLDTWKFGGESFSVETYIKYDSFNNNSRIFDFGSGDPSNNVFISNSSTIPDLITSITNGNVQDFLRVEASEELDLSTNIWIHIVSTVDSNADIKTYINNTLYQSDNTLLPSSVTRDNHYIGKSSSDSDGYLNATIAYFRWWDGTELSADEVATLYTNRENIISQSLNINLNNDTALTISKNKISMRNNIDIESKNVFGNIDVTYPTYAWEFRNNTGTNDIPDILNGQNATLYEGAYSTSEGMVFDGSDSYVTLEPWEFGEEAFSVEAYVNFHSFNNYGSIFDFGGGDPSNNVVLGNVGTTTTSNFKIWQDSNNLGVQKDNFFVQDIWTHIIASTDISGIMTLYKNGSFDVSGSGYLPLFLTRTNHYIGRSNWSTNEYFNGTIAYLRWWDGTALSADEVATLYTNRENIISQSLNFNIDNDTALTINKNKISIPNNVDIVTTNKEIFYDINVKNPSYAWEFRNNTGTNDILDIVNGQKADLSGGAYSTYEGMVFDGSDDYIELDPWEFGGEAFSFETYLKIESFDNTNYTNFFRIFKFHDVDDTTKVFFGNVQDDQRSNFKIYKANTQTGMIRDADFFPSIPADYKQKIWIHVIGTVDINGIMRLYKNGMLHGFAHGELTLFSKGIKYYIGRDPDYEDQRYFHGTMAYFRWWDGTALSADEVATLYANRENIISQNLNFNIDNERALTISKGKISMPNNVDIESTIEEIVYNLNVSSPSFAWEFRNNTGTSDVSDIINGQNAILYGGAYSTSEGMVFDGTDDYIKLDSWETGGEAFSVEAYVKYDSINNWSRIFDFGDGDGSDSTDASGAQTNILLANVSDSSALEFSTRIDGVNVYIRTEEFWDISSWQHIVVTVDEYNFGRVYKNGTLDSSGTVTETNMITRTNHYIGKSGWSNDAYFDGTIAYFRWWNGYELSEDEVSTLYDNRENIIDERLNFNVRGKNIISCIKDMASILVPLTIQSDVGVKVNSVSDLFTNNIAININDKCTKGEPESVILFSNSSVTTGTTPPSVRQFISGKSHANTAVGGLYFGSSNADGSILTKKFCMMDTGRLGVGVTGASVNYELDVSGEIHTTGAFDLGSSSTGGNIKSGFYTANGTQYWNSVSINTDAENAKWSIIRFGREGRCNIWFYPETVDGVDVTRFYLSPREGGGSVIQIGGNSRTGSYGEDLMFNGNGNVGIGTSTPYEKLSVQGTIMGMGENAFVIERKSDTFNAENTYRRWIIGMDSYSDTNATPFPKYLDHLHFMYYTGSTYSRPLWISGDAVGIFTTDYPAYTLDVNGSIYASYNIISSGRVGIGTTSPSYPLEVFGYTTDNDTSEGAVFYFDQTRSSGVYKDHILYESNINNLSGNATFGVVSQYSFWATNGGFYSTSDERIKTNFVDISDNESLEVLRMIQPKKYNYKAYLERGFNQVYGYIAQQIKEVLPYAVTIKKNQFIPNIYQIADVSYELVTIYDEENGTTSQETKYKMNIYNYDTSNLDPSYSIIKLYDGSNVEHIVNIHSIVDSSNIIIDEDISGLTLFEGKVFLYGQRVDDLHSLNKECINVVTLSAVQELDREVIKLKQEKDALQASHDSLQASHDSLQASHDSLQTELTELKTLLQSKGIID